MSLIFVTAMNLMENRGSIGSPKRTNDYLDLKAVLENTDLEFFFTLSRDMITTESLLKEYGLFDYLLWSTEDNGEKFITNGNYPHKGRRIHMFVLKGKGKPYAA